jgi:hypothetical protein
MGGAAHMTDTTRQSAPEPPPPPPLPDHAGSIPDIEMYHLVGLAIPVRVVASKLKANPENYVYHW